MIAYAGGIRYAGSALRELKADSHRNQPSLSALRGCQQSDAKNKPAIASKCLRVDDADLLQDFMGHFHGDLL